MGWFRSKSLNWHSHDSLALDKVELDLYVIEPPTGNVYSAKGGADELLRDRKSMREYLEAMAIRAD